MRWAGLAALVFSVTAGEGLADIKAPQDLSFYGFPGYIDMPAARNQPDGQLSFSTAIAGKTLRNTLHFQITPRLSGSFRYAALNGFFPDRTLYDRSFDLRYLIAKERRLRPAIAVGLQDFGGTGVYTGEYLVATKQLSPEFEFSAGIGWGRFGSHNGFSNPLRIFGDRFNTRPGAAAGGISTTGQLDAGNWFRGDAALFAGFRWRANDRLSLNAEYSSDNYRKEERAGLMIHHSPVNLGVTYRLSERPGSSLDLHGYYLWGSEAGVQLSYSINPASPQIPGGRETAPLPVLPRYTATGVAAAASWETGAEAGLQRSLGAQGLEIAALEVTGSSATLWLVNDSYDAAAQAIGRAARTLTHYLPAEVTTFRIVTTANGVPVSAVTFARGDLEELENAPDGSWQSFARARITDAAQITPGDHPATEASGFSVETQAYISPSLFDPQNPLRADAGMALLANWRPVPGLSFSAGLRQPLIGNLDQIERVSDSLLPHVRTDAALYEAKSELEISHLSAEYIFRSGPDTYGRLTFGYLEKMYGGLSAELLWKPVRGPVAFGAELNYARKRDYDQLFGFRDYDVLSGHLSAYYDFGDGFHGQLDVGRYLAGDSGATLTIDREFNNGWRVGAFATLTDAGFTKFGEGSFDKGIRLTVPLSWLSGEPSRKGFSATIRPVTRDGGARLDVRNRLYELTRGYHAPALNARWGRFWR